MNEITIGGFGSGGQPQTMNSKEIAELCEKRHSHVLRDIRAFVGAVVQMERGVDVKSLDWDGEEGVQLFGQTPIGGVSCTFETNTQNGQSYPVYHLDKSATLTIVAGYNVLLRKRIIDRWQELEANPFAAMMPQDYPSALRALADKTENEQRLIAKVEADAPKVAFAEQIEVAPDAISIGQAGKTLGTGRNRLAAHLRHIGWINRFNEPYQSTINSGLMDVKVGSWEHPDKGLMRSVTALITGKGLAKLHGTLDTHH